DAERPPQVRLGAGVDPAPDAVAGLGVLLDEREGFLAEERRRVHGHLAGFGSRSFSQAAPARSAARSAGGARGTIGVMTAPLAGESASPLDALGAFLDRSERLFVLTGAGCSTESGIPDYRDDAGGWKHRRPTTYQRFVGSEAVMSAIQRCIVGRAA